MKGLDLAERYFLRFGLPLIRDRYPAYAGRIAAGLVGDGSDCLGFDDEQSRDHDWGPGFNLWLTAADHQQIGAALQRDYLDLPGHFCGFVRHAGAWGHGRVGVFEIGDFYKEFIGRPGAPVTLGDWVRIPEKNLAACTSGKVFHDPLGDFSRIRNQLLGFYPQDVRLAKIAARCMSAGQSGQYNLRRCSSRGEIFAAQYAETKFCADVMSLVYLINHRYAPYYKWLHRGLAGLSCLGGLIHQQIVDLMAADAIGDKLSIVDRLCATVIAELRDERLTDTDSCFLLDHGPVVHEKIADPALRAMNVWAG